VSGLQLQVVKEPLLSRSWCSRAKHFAMHTIRIAVPVPDTVLGTLFVHNEGWSERVHCRSCILQLSLSSGQILLGE
jgi:hypothetical protein